MAASTCAMEAVHFRRLLVEMGLPQDEPTTLYNVACVYAQQGRHDDAIECLEGAVIRGFRQKAWFENDSDLDALRDSPRFVALLENLS